MYLYGDLVGNEAVIEALSYANRHVQGLPEGVIHLFLYSTFLINKGQSIVSAFGESPTMMSTQVPLSPDFRAVVGNRRGGSHQSISYGSRNGPAGLRIVALNLKRKKATEVEICEPNHYGCRFTCHGYIVMKIHWSLHLDEPNLAISFISLPSPTA